MRKLSTILTVALAAGTLLSACSDSGKESSAVSKGNPETQTRQQTENKPVPPVSAPTTQTPAKEDVKSPEEPMKEAEPKPDTAPPAQQQTVASQTYQPPKQSGTPTAADKKAVSWYYMKKKKGEVPGFPAEIKQLKPDQKAVWVGTGKKVYMTIDLGGELLDYKTLLKALKDNQVSATFFVTGYNLKNNPD
ncbi:MAG: xylanase/chitin deacetylase, partial [Paenibacillus sp.]|nr:xylanase/chitin deacetylase [Paenibacillus sp.]